MPKKNPVQVAEDRILSAKANLEKARERMAAARENMKGARIRLKAQNAAEKLKKK
jgi:hypothetical protein